MSRWFRFYGEAMRHPKVARLSDKDFRFWVALLAIASENNGIIPCLDDLVLALRERRDYAERALKRLCDNSLLEPKADCYEPHNWGKHQYKSDTSTDRVHKFRGKRNVSETPVETPPESEADTDTERKSPAPNGATKSLREKPDTALYRRGKEILGPKLGGKVIKALIANTGELDDVRRKLIRISESADPAAYATAILRGYENPIAADDWIT
jgi:hypothetical protein